MAEPTTTAATLASASLSIASTATGMTVLGYATGIDPVLLIAGFAGGLWSHSYADPLPRLQRIAYSVLAGLIAAWVTPILAVIPASFDWWPRGISIHQIQFPIAMTIGFLSHQVIGPQLLRIAQKKAEEIA